MLLVAIGLTLPGFAGAKILRLTSITFLCEMLCASSMLISDFLLSALDSGLSSMRIDCFVFRKGPSSSFSKISSTYWPRNFYSAASATKFGGSSPLES